MKLTALLNEDHILREHLGDSYSSYSQSELREISDIASELQPIFEELVNEINSNETLLNEGFLDRAKAKVAGAVEGGKQLGKNITGKDSGTSPKDAAKLKALNVRLNSFKKNIGTATAQYQKDMGKLGMDDNPLFKKLFAEIERTLKNGPDSIHIEIKDRSLSAKAGEVADAGRKKAMEKLMPIVQKTTKKVGDKMEALYQKSGPMKNFDDKYKQVVEKFKKSNPGISDAMNKFSKVALKHKGKATFITGAMVALLTAAGATGPAAPIVMGIGMRGIYGMLAGEPPAKAFGKAAITSLVGKLVGGGVKEFFGSIFDGMPAPGAIDGGDMADNLSDTAGGSIDLAPDINKWGDGLGEKIQALIDKQDFEVDGNNIKGFHSGAIFSGLSEEDQRLIRLALSKTNSSTSMNMAEKKFDMYVSSIAAGQNDADKFGDYMTKALSQKVDRLGDNEKALGQLDSLLDKANSASVDASGGADAGGDAASSIANEPVDYHDFAMDEVGDASREIDQAALDGNLTDEQADALHAKVDKLDDMARDGKISHSDFNKQLDSIKSEISGGGGDGGETPDVAGGDSNYQDSSEVEKRAIAREFSSEHGIKPRTASTLLDSGFDESKVQALDVELKSAVESGNLGNELAQHETNMAKRNKLTSIGGNYFKDLAKQGKLTSYILNNYPDKANDILASLKK